MASLSDKNPDNVPGAYYIDSSCIDCDQCRETAPEIYDRNDDTGDRFVKRQPVTDDEIARAEEALAGCATESIGNDGN